MRFFNISHVPRILQVSKAKCPEDIVTRVIDDLLTVCKLRGPMTQCNEKGREKFIDVVCNLLKDRRRVIKHALLMADNYFHNTKENLTIFVGTK